MIRWGISAGHHDAAISVVEDDKILFAGHAERYSGIKNDKNLNQFLVQEALQYGEPEKIFWHESPFWKNTRRIYAGQKWQKNNVKELLRSFGLDYWTVEYATHHQSHAAAGMFTSPFINSIVIVIDAIGEWTTSSIWSGAMGKFWSTRYPTSLGMFYSAITDRCELKANEDEYILMGMAAYGDPDIYYDQMRQLLNQNLHNGCRNWLPGVKDYYDFAASAQKIYEEEFRKILEISKKYAYNNNLVLQGGCALNCVANNIALEYYDNVWIMPNPGDAGASLGAVLAHTHQHVDFTPYLGHNIEGPYPGQQLLNELLKGNMVGVANGRAEYGPRALGNRSLLADPRGVDVKDKVNKIKRRQEFRPFAPVILEEEASKYFEMPVKEAPFMQYTAKCKEPKKYPAIVHVDGTSRVQTVTRKQHPGLYQLLVAFKNQTGCPMLLNTSLNIKGKPIVNTSEDGIMFSKKYDIKVF
jgi:carbamoyltransferase|tara:strand:- start:355 stop:1761 length:1407 start_codon:yes stop_codon:yes gene_type:complete